MSRVRERRHLLSATRFPPRRRARTWFRRCRSPCVQRPPQRQPATGSGCKRPGAHARRDGRRKRGDDAAAQRRRAPPLRVLPCESGSRHTGTDTAAARQQLSRRAHAHTREKVKTALAPRARTATPRSACHAPRSRNARSPQRSCAKRRARARGAPECREELLCGVEAKFKLHVHESLGIASSHRVPSCSKLRASLPPESTRFSTQTRLSHRGRAHPPAEVVCARIVPSCLHACRCWFSCSSLSAQRMHARQLLRHNLAFFAASTARLHSAL